MARFAGFKLPGGRGAVPGPGAQNLLGEQMRQRSKELDILTPGYVSSVPGPTTLTSSSVSTANVNYYVPIAMAPYVVEVVAAKMRVTSASAGHTLYTALYVWDPAVDTRRLHILPGSHADVPFTSATLYITDLERPVTLMPHQQMFLGYRASSAVPKFAGVPRVVNSVLATLAQTGLSDLPDIVDFGTVVKCYTCPVPQIYYVSKLYKELF